MIGKLTGTLAEKNPPHILIDCQGVGYEVLVSMNTFYHLPAPGERVSLATQLIVREDAHLLYGFGSAQERSCFRELIKVSGLGPKTALALDDSLTQGVGASAEQAFPPLLAQATGWQVVNAGVSGDTSAQALARLPELLQQHRPQLVIVGIGGNDFLRRQSTSQTKQNITRIVQACLDADAQVLLVAIPGLGLLATAGLLSDHAMYEEIADELGVPLLADAWAQVLSEPQLRSDQIHANAQGYAAFTDKLLAGLRAHGLLR